MVKFYFNFLAVAGALAAASGLNAQNLDSATGVDVKNHRVESVRYISPKDIVSGSAVQTKKAEKETNAEAIEWDDVTFAFDGEYYFTAWHPWGDMSEVEVYNLKSSEKADTAAMGILNFWNGFFGVSGATNAVYFGIDAEGNLSIPDQWSGFTVGLTTGDKAKIYLGDGRQNIKPEYQYKYAPIYDEELGEYTLYVTYNAYSMQDDNMGYFGYGWETLTNTNAWSEFAPAATGIYSHVFFTTSEDDTPTAQNMNLYVRESLKSGRYTEFYAEDWGAGLATRSGMPALFRVDNKENTVSVPLFDTGYTMEIVDDYGETYEVNIMACDATVTEFAKVPWEKYPCTWDPATQTMSLNLVYHYEYPDGFVEGGQDLSGYSTFWYPDVETFTVAIDTKVKDVKAGSAIDWKNGVIYNILGQRVYVPEKGKLYLVNGKKAIF